MSLIEHLSWTGPVLVVPGLHGSGAQHWQTRWERRNPRLRRVEQADWKAPDLDRWARQIIEAAVTLDGPALVVAHSFGCLAAVRAQAFQSSLIAGALLVAPANPQKFSFDAPLSQQPLPFPSVLVASQNDPWMPFETARYWAERWGSSFENVGRRGHINADSGLADWDHGQQMLEALCQHLNGGTPRAREPVPVSVAELRWAA